MNHARKTLSNKSHFGGIEGVGHYRQGQTSQTKVNHLGRYSHSLSLSLFLDWVYSYSELLIPSDISLSQGTIKKRVRSSSYKYFWIINKSNTICFIYHISLSLSLFTTKLQIIIIGLIAPIKKSRSSFKVLNKLSSQKSQNSFILNYVAELIEFSKTTKATRRDIIRYDITTIEFLKLLRIFDFYFFKKKKSLWTKVDFIVQIDRFLYNKHVICCILKFQLSVKLVLA